MAIPLWRLTHERTEAAPVEAAVSETGGKAIHLQLSFTQMPREFKVLYSGKAVWTETAPRQDEARDLKIPFPPEGIDLQFEIGWTGDALAAAKIQVTIPDGRVIERSIWSKGTAEEVVTFQ